MSKEQIKKMGLEYDRLIKLQEKIIKKGCPLCGEKLTTCNLLEVRCAKCKKIFDINQLRSLSFALSVGQ